MECRLAEVFSPGRLDRALDVGVVLLVGAIALKLGHDHARWVAADLAPTLDEDSQYHIGRILQEWRAFMHAPGLLTLFPVGNYPPVVSWFTWAEWARNGVSASGMRTCQVAFTPILVVGSAAMGWRTWGRAAALPAAALAVAVPMQWLQRSNVMLALAVTAFVALSYATVPIDMRRLRPLRTAGAGVIAGLALLSHLSAVYFVFALGVGATIEAGITVWRERGLWKVALGRLGIWTGVALAVCAPYYARSMGIILSVLDAHDQKYVQANQFGGWDALVFLVRIQHGFLLDWLQIAAEVGLLLTILVARWRPMARCYLVAAVLGFCGIVTFPQAHDRYLLPLVPLITCFAMAPLGLLVMGKRWGSARAVLAIGLAVCGSTWGLAFSARSMVGAPEATEAYAAGPGAVPPQAGRDRVIRALLTGPAERAWTAPAPHAGFPGVEAVVAALPPAAGVRIPKPPRPRLIVETGQRATYAAELLIRGSEFEVLGGSGECGVGPCYRVFASGARDPERMLAIGATRVDVPGVSAVELWREQ